MLDGTWWPEETRRETKIKAESPRVYLPLLRTFPQWDRESSQQVLARASRIILVSFPDIVFDERSFEVSRVSLNAEGIRGHAKWRFMRLRVFLSPACLPRDPYSLRNFIWWSSVPSIRMAYRRGRWRTMETTGFRSM